MHEAHYAYRTNASGILHQALNIWDAKINMVIMVNNAQPL